jgi:4-alpha-glucanotransferase
MSPDRRLAGVLVPLFALRGADDLGIGDVRALREFIDWCASAGFGVVNLLPLNEPGTDPSPYNPISVIAIDPLSISVHPDDLEDITAEAFADAIRKVAREQLAEGPVRYRAIRDLKFSLLASAFQQFRRNALANETERASQFREFVERESAWLRPYGLFRALMSRHGHERWTEWPGEHRTAAKAEEWFAQLSSAERAGVEERIREISYVQWIAQAQWIVTHAHAQTRGVALMGDIPLGVNFYSAEVFAAPELFRLDWSCGAPPDALSIGAPQDIAPADAFRARWGQNWGFPVYNWDAMRRDGMRWWRRRVSKLRAFVDMFRIDHILGFYRVYAFPWRPEQNDLFIGMDVDAVRARTGGRLPIFLPRDDESAESRAANQAEGESLLQPLVDEAGEGTLIGEDLGCVPDYVRPSLARMGIAGYKVPGWEVRDDGTLIPGGEYEPLSVAMYVTHDHAPLRAQWREWAGSVRKARAKKNAEPPTGTAEKQMRQLWKFAGLPDNETPSLRFTVRLHRALIRALLQSRSWLVVFMITDLFAREERFNVPGATGDENWTQRMHVPIHDLNRQPQTRWLKSLLRLTGRAIRGRGPVPAKSVTTAD